MVPSGRITCCACTTSAERFEFGGMLRAPAKLRGTRLLSEFDGFELYETTGSFSDMIG
jgi:hypothetical protein